MKPTHFLSLENETPASLRTLLDRAAHWKRAVRSKTTPQIFAPNDRRTTPLTLALLFEKPSLRTRVSFEMGMHHFGGKALYLSPFEVGLNKREATKDVARVLGRCADAIMARVFHHRDIEILAAESGVPVINGLSDEEHPCQAVADLLAIEEDARESKSSIEKTTIAFVGDGNNCCHSLMRGAALLGAKFLWIGPKGYEPKESYVEWSRKFGAAGSSVELTHDFDRIREASHLYTDVWASMGQEEETAARKKIFANYALDERVFKLAPKAGVLHCLPAHRNEEISDAVIDSPRSLAFEEAENRVYGQMAVLERLLGGR